MHQRVNSLIHWLYRPIRTKLTNLVSFIIFLKRPPNFHIKSLNFLLIWTNNVNMSVWGYKLSGNVFNIIIWCIKYVVFYLIVSRINVSNRFLHFEKYIIVFISTYFHQNFNKELYKKEKLNIQYLTKYFLLFGRIRKSNVRITCSLLLYIVSSK